MKPFIVFFMIFILSVPTEFKNSESKLKIPEVQASGPFLLIRAVVGAYQVYARTRTVTKAKRALRVSCERLADAYQKLKGNISCENTCGGMPGGRGRVNCFSNLISRTSGLLEGVNEELNARTAFQIYCAATGAGRRRTSDGTRSGAKWSDDEGHRVRIEQLKNQRDKCKSLIDQARRNTAEGKAERNTPAVGTSVK